jgi:hypothetical protein
MSRIRHVSATIVAALVAAVFLIPSPADGAATTATSESQTTLRPGQSITSPDGRHRLVHQHDGNVVFYGPNGGVWQTKTVGRDTAALVFQDDGNLVLYGEGRALWHTGTHGRGEVLAVQNDSNVVVYAPDKPVWAVRGMTPPLDVRGSTADGCGGWRHTVGHYFGGETATGCRVLMCESQGNRYADNPTSSASGLWQFLDGTWRSTTGKPGPAANYSPSYQTWAAKRLRDTGGWGHWACY